MKEHKRISALVNRYERELENGALSLDDYLAFLVEDAIVNQMVMKDLEFMPHLNKMAHGRMEENHA